MIHLGYDISHIDLTVEHKTSCPQCKDASGDWDDDNLHVYGEDEDGKIGGFRCFACGYSMTSDIWKEENGAGFEERKGLTIAQKDINKFNEKKLTEVDLKKINLETTDELTVNYRGLDKDVCKKLGIRWKIEDGKVSEMLFPAYTVVDGNQVVSGYKIRKYPKDFYSKGYVGKVNLLAGQTNQVADTLIIVAGEIDLITAIQSLESVKKYNKTVNVVSSLIGEDSTADCIRNHFEWVDKHQKIIICMDNDDAGNKAFEKIKQVISNDKLFKANLKYNDLNDYLKNKEGDQIAKDLYWNAVAVEDYGIIGSGDLFEYGIEAAKDEGIPVPFHMLDLKPYVPMFMYDSIVLIVGSTSIGKTANLDTTTNSIIMSSKDKTGVLSLEASRKKFAQKMASRIIGTPLNRLPKDEQIELQMKYKDKINDFYLDENGDHRFFFADSDFDSVQEAEKCIIRLITVFGCKVIIADPLQNIIGNKTNEEQRSFMLFLEKVKKKYGVLILLGTHTRKATSGEKSGSDGGVQKEDSIEGSGSISKSSSLIITLSRNKNAEDWIERNTTYYSVPKNRDFELTGELVARSFYRSSCSRLYPYSYAEKHNFFKDDKIGDIIEDDVGFYLSATEFENIQDNSEIKKIVEDVKESETKDEDLPEW